MHPMARQPTFAVHISLTLSLKNVYSDLAERLLSTVTGRSYGVGCVHTGVFRKRNSRCIWVSSSSCITCASGVKRYFLRSSSYWSRKTLESNMSVRGLFRLGLWRIRPGSPRAYSPLSFASRARFPVSSPMDSPTWGRWWFAAHPNRALRLPAWREVAPGALLSTFQHAHVIHAVGSLLFITEVETGCCPCRCGRTGGAFPEG